MPGYTSEATERISFAYRVMTSLCLQSGSKQSATIDMGNFRRLVVLSAALSTAATTTVPHATIKVLDSTQTGSAVHTAIASNTIMAQTAGFARFSAIEIRSEDITQNIASPGSTLGRYVRVRAIYGTRAVQVAVAVLGIDSRFEPNSNTVTLG